MKWVNIVFSDDEERQIGYYLRKRYRKNKRTNMNSLCKIAILTEMANSAKNELLKLEAK